MKRVVHIAFETKKLFFLSLKFVSPHLILTKQLLPLLIICSPKEAILYLSNFEDAMWKTLLTAVKHVNETKIKAK
ncbi:hypothetical protein L596_015765 [Steinernema carpocapsae]|uniref:Uncharacterized protein n=1 Tax=Steinernema carpocapsae TaxID=34508 RepID=A0A4U5NFZ9_STECR|nr:hypothetical protein L596_015756 [Steinernema carpocapsae]TKR81976.1 hypothetical protein L596_015765 [Steinernema carpocapsae]